MKLCGIFMAYQRLCVSCFGAHQQPIQEQHGGTSSTVHSTLESVFLKNCPTVWFKGKFFFQFFCQMEPASLKRGDFSSSQKHLILAYSYCTGFPILVHCVVGTTQNFLCLKKMAKFLTFLKLLISR